MSIRNEVVLITYADSLGSNLNELGSILAEHFAGAIGGVHLLPFYPSSADRGFAPMEYDSVDRKFGTWADIEQIAKRHWLMVDFMINHISRSSRYFADFIQRKDQSPYAHMFIRYRDFWPSGEPTSEQLDLIYKRKPRAPFVTVDFADGTVEKIWCTFDEEQIDLDLTREVTRSFVRDTLTFLARRGAAVVRLDAFAYATKKAGTTCFFVEPAVWQILDDARSTLEPFDVEVLPEIHEHYSLQVKLAEQGYWVYDFALPMLLLHTLSCGSSARLLNWLRICPRKQFTTLDTHDGIGIADVRDLLSEEEIEGVRARLFAAKANVKRIYSTAIYKNLDIYQINCTYYSALGCSDDAYLIARAIQFFAPGIPQIYYVGLLAGENDISLVEKTRNGRDINRHCYTKSEVDAQVSRPVVRRLINLMKFRNQYPAFDNEVLLGDQDDPRSLVITRTSGKYRTTLTADLITFAFEISYYNTASGKMELLTGV
ncbi:MAG TPA: sucrose phosphorylase [Spirochaetia bacterium]|nr:sucrose phosphorylase [Spirochaetia bacterium]